MAQDTELISEYVDRSGIEADTAFILKQLQEVQNALNQTNKNKISLDSAKTFRQAAESANSLKQSTVQLVDAQGRLISSSTGIAAGTEKAAAGAKKQKDAYTALNDEYKQLLRNAENAALEFGAQSEQALEAAAAADKVKQKLQEAKDVARSGGQKVEFTSNLDELEKERQAAEKTGDAVTDLEEKQTDAILGAIEWGKAQGDAGKEAEDSAKKLKELADAFENTETPFSNLTGTFKANIQTQVEYKNRLKEIADELRELNKDPEANKGRIVTLTKEQSELKIASSELGQTINAQVKYLQAAEGSVDQLSQKLGLMKNAFRQMTDQEKQSSFGKQFLADIQTLDTEVKRQDALIGNFQRNVGNYANSLSPFFDKLAEQITKLKQEQQGLQDLSQRNPVGFQIGGGADRLNQVTGFIQKLEEVQQIGFKTGGGNTAQQINTIDKALQDAAKDGGQTSEVFKELVQDLNEIKGASSVTGSTFAGAMKVLENELSAVRQKLQDPTLTGAQFKKLEQEEQLLSQLTQNLGRVFTSSREQLKAFAEASVQLGTQLGATDERFLAFQNQVGAATNEVKDLKASLNFQSQDAKFLNGAISAVNGLVGAFAAGQAAVQLFDEDSQELQRTMVKLQALLTILTSLTAVSNALQTENGAIQLALEAKIKLVNAAKAIQAKLFTQGAAAAQADAVAQGEDAAAAEANTVAQGETAAAAGGAATAMEAESVAAGAAATGISRLTAALAVGLGAAFVAIAAAIAYGVSKLNDWVGRHIEAIKRAGELADAIRDENGALIEQANLFSKSQEGLKNYFQKQLDFTQAAGISTEKQFALRKRIALEEKTIAEAQLSTLGVTQKQQTVLLSQIESLQAQKQQYTEQLQVAINAKDKTGIEAIQTNIESVNKQLGSLTPLYEAAVAARQRVNDANKNIAQVNIEEQAFSDAERRKLILAETQVEVDLIKNRNERILNDERSTLAQRLDAIRSNTAQEKRLIEAQRQDVIQNPGSTKNDIQIANDKANADIKKANRQRDIDILNERNVVRKRDIQATIETEKQRLAIESETEKEIYTNQVFTLNQRLQALQQFNVDQKAALQDTLQSQLVNLGLNDKEVENFMKNGKAETDFEKDHAAELNAIWEQYQEGILKLNDDTQNSVVDILRSELAKQKQLFDQNISDIQASYDKVDLSLHINYSEEIVALNDALKKREITVEQYAKRREEIEFQSQHKITENAIHSLEDQLSKFQDTEEKEVAARAKVEALKQELSQATTKEMKAEIKKQIEIAEDQLKIAAATNAEYEKLAAQLAALKAKYSDETKGNDDKTKESEKQRVTKYLDAAIALNDQLGALSDALADRRIANIKREQDALEERYSREIDIINQSTTNSVDREKKIADAEARHAAQKNALDQQEKRENLKKAQFEKAQTITSILLNTAKAIVQDLGNPFKIVVDAAIGATQLATAIATPLPQYFRGKNVSDAPKTAMDTYEGPAIVGDGGKSELIIREDGRMEVTPAQSTVTFLKSKDIVLPDAKKALQQMQDVTNNMDNRVSNVSSTTTVQTYNMARRYESTKSEDVQYRRFNDTMRSGFQSLEHVIKNKKELHVHFADRGKALVHSGKSWQEILNK